MSAISPYSSNFGILKKWVERTLYSPSSFRPYPASTLLLATLTLTRVTKETRREEKESS